MTDWSSPLTDNEIDWSKPMEEQYEPAAQMSRRRPKSPFPGKGFALGLGQWMEDTLKGLTSHGAEPEVDIPEFMRHPRLSEKPEVNRSPSFNLEQYVDPEQQMQFNVGKYGPDVAALGFGAIKGAGKLLKPLTNKGLGQSIVNEVKGLKKGFNKDYNSFFDKTEKLGLNKIDISKSTVNDMSNVLENVTDKKYYKALQKAIDNPTPRNIHFAQSDLGKFIRKWKDKNEIPTPVYEALKSANKAQNALKGDLYRGLMKKGGLEAPFEYANLSERYAKSLVPYLENTAVRKASLKPGQKGYIKPERLPRKLKLESSDPLMAHLRANIEGTKNPLNPYLKGKHPLLEINRALAPLVKYGGVGTMGYGGYELIKKLLENG